MPIRRNELDQISYLPALRSRTAELRGYRELRGDTKSELIPLLSLGNLGRIRESHRVLERSMEVVGRAFIDLNLNPDQACSDFAELADPTNNFERWRRAVEQFDDAVPVPILREDASLRSFVRQVIEIENTHGVVMIRSRQPATDLARIEAAIAVVDDVDNLIVALDFGYIRGGQEAKEHEARRVMNSLRNSEPSLRIVVLASSFPRSVTAYGESGCALSILERDFHARLGGDAVAIYGDHCSIYPEPFAPMRARFVPRIDFPTETDWIYRRHRQDHGGYTRCATEIVALEEWEEADVARFWGSQMIRNAADARDVPDGFGAPANWIAVRVNLHIEKQLRNIAEDDEDDYDEDI